MVDSFIPSALAASEVVNKSHLCRLVLTTMHEACKFLQDVYLRLSVTQGDFVKQPRNPFDFAWQIAESGYEWRENQRHKRNAQAPSRVLVPKPSEMWRRYLPLVSEPGLFMKLADTPATEEGVVEFAAQYGVLGIPIHASVDGLLQLGAESLSAWQEEIRVMRRLLAVWQCVTSRDMKRLAEVVKWDDKGVAFQWIVKHKGKEHVEAHRILASPEIHPERLDRFAHGDLIQPALLYLQIEINAELEKHPAPAKLLRTENGKISLYCVPDSLVAALWLQFALAIDGNKHYKLCEGCNRWFEVGTGTSAGAKRRDARACSSTCRQRLQRREKANVRL
jgi:hypothetical protein